MAKIARYSRRLAGACAVLMVLAPVGMAVHIFAFPDWFVMNPKMAELLLLDAGVGADTYDFTLMAKFAALGAIVLGQLPLLFGCSTPSVGCS